MKTAVVRGLVESLLERHGATVRAGTGALIESDLPAELAKRIGPPRVSFALTPRDLEGHPESELATAGNPVFDRLLALATSGGVIGVRYEAIPAGSGEASEGAPPARSRRIYVPVYLFVFQIEYSREELPDELETIAIDAVDGRAVASLPDVVDHWSGAGETPEAGRSAVEPFPIPEAIVSAALATLEKRLRKRVGRLREGSERQLARELASIQRYYEQLIEEARHTGRRWNVGPDERKERVNLLQLDWRRRSEQAQELWRPRVRLRLLGVGAMHRPRLLVGGAEKPIRRSSAVRATEEAWPRTGTRIWDEVERRELTARIPPAPGAGDTARGGC